MRFSYAESMCDPEQYFPLAIAAEQAGYTSFCIPDSILYPEASDTRYPYTPDGNREFLEGKPFLEPFALIPALGAVTERLRFTTFVMKFAIRHPVLVAKQATSIAVLTKNRLGFGIGLSPWPEDFAACGVPWAGRGERMDEMMQIVRGLGSGEYFGFQGKHFQLDPIKLCPVPTRPIPLLVGGHAEPALRRAARLGDGWMHAGGDGQALAGMLARLAALRREYGTERRPFEIHVISLDGFSVDGVRRLEDQGVTDAIVGFRNAYERDTMTLQQKLDALHAFADRVIAKV
ncbi:MAG TPA: TIGR03619 family F420-dependent LLM class oxidoreductase [Myxococcota bacterium]|nr:TIGR03619 family F420-dependent LLM class oxidoreductase [Myxococcota bacterium]